MAVSDPAVCKRVVDPEMGTHQSKHQKKWQEGHDTRDSRVVTHRSTNRARRCLTSEIGRDPVLSTWYGRVRPCGLQASGGPKNVHASIKTQKKWQEATAPQIPTWSPTVVLAGPSGV